MSIVTQVIIPFLADEEAFESEIIMPRAARILSIIAENGIIKIFTLAMPNAAPEKRYFSVYRDGMELPAKPGIYVGTFGTAYEPKFLFEVFPSVQS